MNKRIFLTTILCFFFSIVSVCEVNTNKIENVERIEYFFKEPSKIPFEVNEVNTEIDINDVDSLYQYIFHYQGHLSELESQMVSLANEIEEYKIIQTIPGIGKKIAATIISEIGGIDRFNHPKKLVAYSGIDLSVHSSGKFTATNRITKRGSSTLRYSLYLAILCGIRSSRNKKLKAFYDKETIRRKAFKSSACCLH